MENNCFVNNKVAGNAVATVVNEPENPFLNNFGTHGRDLDCQFAFVGNHGNATETVAGVSSGKCIDFDATVCALPFEYEAEVTHSSASSIVSVLFSIGLGVLTSAILFI
jgi:hypothetical protein